MKVWCQRPVYLFEVKVYSSVTSIDRRMVASHGAIRSSLAVHVLRWDNPSLQSLVVNGSHSQARDSMRSLPHAWAAAVDRPSTPDPCCHTYPGLECGQHRPVIRRK